MLDLLAILVGFLFVPGPHVRSAVLAGCRCHRHGIVVLDWFHLILLRRSFCRLVESDLLLFLLSFLLIALEEILQYLVAWVLLGEKGAFW